MLKVAIVGCGKIADQHLLAIRRIPDCELVGVCDREVLMARQLGERFGVSRCFSDVDEMLRGAAPEVVHITTPPQSHSLLARQCLAGGCHVYLEKPFTVTADEAEALLKYADSCGRIITVGHNYQFTLEMLEMRRLVRGGALGGKPVHLESHWSYELGDAGYVAAMLGSPAHWVRQLPGQLLHNLISHGIAKLAEFLGDELEEVVAMAHQSPLLQRMGGQEVLDELRVFIRDRTGTTGFFCFSTQIRPVLNQLRICGPAALVVADITNGCLIKWPGRSYKSYLTYVVPPLMSARQYLSNASRNIVSFLRQRLYQDFGMTELIGRFYTSIRTGGPPPIPHREILLTARIMDDIFAQIRSRHQELTDRQRILRAALPTPCGI
ncbi:MAG: Gfo/Idh/MocA family oxidoreductase [Verrucomicrobiales bacterium]|nr:Gfo/Idh/MocA family oxidoreductase [Verrucomicrobiales bacterium]